MTGRVTIERPEFFDRAYVERRWGGNLPRVVVLVKGTGDPALMLWAEPGSAFRRLVLEPYGIAVAARVDYWSGALWFPCDDWKAGGVELAAALAMMPITMRNVLAHSHGLQVATCAATSLQIYRLTSLSGPIRKDMMQSYAIAAHNAAFVTQISDTKLDRIQWGGQWFGFTGISDRFLPLQRPFPEGSNVTEIRIPDIGHSRLLDDPQAFELWAENGLIRRVTDYGDIGKGE